MLQAEQELACDKWVVQQGGSRTALWLAGALLKVWEDTSRRPKHRKRYFFQAPGLASATKGNLLEKRVSRLLEIGEVGSISLPHEEIAGKFQANGLLGGGFGLWLVGLELIHLIMMPLGCAVSLGMF